MASILAKIALAEAGSTLIAPKKKKRKEQAYKAKHQLVVNNITTLSHTWSSHTWIYK